MKIVLGFIALGVAFAVLRMAVVALTVVLLFFLLLAFVTRPRETLSYVLCLGLCGLMTARPVACIVTLGIITLAMMAVGALQKAATAKSRSSRAAALAHRQTVRRDRLSLPSPEQ
jgi:predicted membrane protein